MDRVILNKIMVINYVSALYKMNIFFVYFYRKPSLYIVIGETDDLCLFAFFEFIMFTKQLITSLEYKRKHKHIYTQIVVIYRE